jgi:hypothetical protein
MQDDLGVLAVGYGHTATIAIAIVAHGDVVGPQVIMQ